jgi:hypothetical protein
MRLLSTILAAISMLLLIGVLFFYVRSYWLYEGNVHYSEGGQARAALTVRGKRGEGDIPGRMSGLLSYKGEFTYASIAVPTEEPAWQSWSNPLDEPLKNGAMSLMYPTVGSRFGYASGEAHVADKDLAWELPYWNVTIPYWLPVVLLAIGPWRWFVNYRVALQREKEGKCIRCGADLRGAKDKCPKCGEGVGEDG